MLNEKIKKLIYMLLLVAIAYISIFLLPFITKVLTYLFSLLIPFIIAFVLSFILQPVVEFFKRRGLKRPLAVIVVVVIFLAIIIIIVSISLPYLLREIAVLIESVPHIVEQLEIITNSFAKKFSFLPPDYQPTFDNISFYLTEKLSSLSHIPEKILSRFLNYLSIVVLVPMLTIYFLLDYEKIFCYLRNKLIEHDKIHLRNYLGELNKTMSSYFRGMFLVMIIFSMTATVAFLFIGLDFALFFGIIIGVTNVIPYLGPYIGASFPIVYALIDSPQKAILIALICYIMQFLETNFLTPYVHSRNLKIHPILIILSLIFFGKLFGILGMVFAVPLMSIIVITLKYYPRRKEKR